VLPTCGGGCWWCPGARVSDPHQRRWILVLPRRYRSRLSTFQAAPTAKVHVGTNVLPISELLASTLPEPKPFCDTSTLPQIVGSSKSNMPRPPLGKQVFFLLVSISHVNMCVTNENLHNGELLPFILLSACCVHQVWYDTPPRRSARLQALHAGCSSDAPNSGSMSPARSTAMAVTESIEPLRPPSPHVQARINIEDTLRELREQLRIPRDDEEMNSNEEEENQLLYMHGSSCEESSNEEDDGYNDEGDYELEDLLIPPPELRHNPRWLPRSRPRNLRTPNVNAPLTGRKRGRRGRRLRGATARTKRRWVRTGFGRRRARPRHAWEACGGRGLGAGCRARGRAMHRGRGWASARKVG
jgi:hypothetical protein